MLFTFPSRYWYAIGLTRVFSLAGWARRIRAGLHVSRVTQDTTDWHVRTSKGLSPAMAGLSRPFLLSHTMTLCGPTTPQRRRHNCGLGSSPVARHYWGNHCYFLFLEVLRCFSSLRLPPYTYIGITTLQVAGLSHSEIAGSEVICTYPALIAAYHVLHRLREPRHPPSALYYFLFAIVHTFSCHAKPH